MIDHGDDEDKLMQIKVDGMTCGHCEAAVIRAVQGVDPAARVRVDRAAGMLSVDGSADPAALAEALRAAGYPATAQ